MTPPSAETFVLGSALSSVELQNRLEILVDRVLSSRRSVRPAAETLGRHWRAEQERFLEAVELISRTSVELAFNFCMFAPRALRILAPEEWHDWVVHLLERYDRGGVLDCIAEIERVEAYRANRRDFCVGISFEDVSLLLERFLCGLSGRPLKLAFAEATYTDTETIYLPARLVHFAMPQDNCRLYKAMAVHLWAQTRFGTWQVDLMRVGEKYADSDRAIRLFHVLETRRLDGCIQQELPGLYREMRRLHTLTGAEPEGTAWVAATQRLDRVGASVLDSLALLPVCYHQLVDATPPCYAGTLYPERVRMVRELRLERERLALQHALVRLQMDHLGSSHEALRPPPSDDERSRVEVAVQPDPQWPARVQIELRLDGQPLRPPEDVQQLFESILQDLGEIPDHYLVPAGHGCYRTTEQRMAHQSHEAPKVEEGTYTYHEWDYACGRYRSDWCLVRERMIHPGAEDFAAKTLQKHRGLLKHLYRMFEALRGDDRRLRRQQDGDQVDIDAVVESYVEVRNGREGSQKLFSQLRRVHRNVAVMFMADMSGSTKGWVSEIERESLVLLCEALEVLQDRYAIYGFSGFTHKLCELFRVKHFDESYGDAVKARIGGIKPLDYTRMGAAIRHLTRLLLEQEARTRLLVALSDGRPDDQDGYRGTYGIEDTRQALIEARGRGVYSYCITIDDEAMDYLPRMYGPAGFTVVSDVAKLPWKISDIYRRITF